MFSCARYGEPGANLSTICKNFAARYESLCATSHRLATVAGFLLWAEVSLEEAMVAVDQDADASKSSPATAAKGLEWPVVVSWLPAFLQL